MVNFNDYANENKAEDNLKWPYIPDHPYRILIIAGSGSWKTNALLNLIKTSQILIKYSSTLKILMNRSINSWVTKKKYMIKALYDPETYTEYSNDMQDVYKNIDEYNPGKNCKILIVFYDIIADMINNKKLNSVVRGRN